MANHDWVSGEADGATNTDALSFETDRWHARLGRLETRLEMLETSLKSEVDRLQLAAENVDAVTEEFRSTVGGVRNLVDLTNDIGDRVSILTALEKRLAGQHDAVASVVADQFDRELAAREERDAAIEQALTHLLGAMRPLEQRLEALTGTVDRLHLEQQDPAGLASPMIARLDQLGAALEEAGYREPDHELHGALDALAARVAALTDEVRASRAESDADTATAPVHERLDALTTAIDELRIAQPDVAPQLQALAETVGDVRSAHPGDTSEITERLDSIGQAVRDLQRQPVPSGPDPAEILDPVNSELAELRSAVTATSEHITLAEVAAAQHASDLAGKLEGLQELIQSSRDQVAEARAVPDEAEESRLDELTAGVTELRDELQAARTELATVNSTLGDMLDELDRQDRVIAESTAEGADAARLEERLDAEFDAVGYQVEALAVLLGEAIEAMHRIESQMVGPQPTTDRMREAAASVVASLRANVRQRSLDRGWTDTGEELVAEAEATTDETVEGYPRTF